MAEAQYIFQQKYKCCRSTLKKVSYDETNQESLCQNEKLCVYDFDKITKKENSSNQLSSCDSLLYKFRFFVVYKSQFPTK